MRSLMVVIAMLFAIRAEAARPHRVIGNVYFVGQDDLASFLIVTPKGNILVNTGYDFSVPEIRESIRLLGFRFQDIKILLVTHAHSDHAGGLAAVKKLTVARMQA